MFTTRILTIASIKMFLRSRQALFFSLFMPFIIMLIFGSIGFDKPQKFDVGIVSGAYNAPTQNIVDQIKAFPGFAIHEGNQNDELWALSDGNRAVVLEFSPDFLAVPATGSAIGGTDLASGATTTPGTVIAYMNEGQAAQAQTVVSILGQYLDKTTLAITHAPTLFTIDQRAVNARNLRYIEFLLPGLIGLSVMQMSVFSVAFVFAQYKEKGVLKRLVATPMQPYQFVLANVITRMMVSVFQAAIFIVVALLLFKVHVLGSYWLILLTVVLGALMFLGLGFTISGFAKTVESVPALANIVVFPMLFLGGSFFPLSSMPDWLQHFAKYLPLTYFSGALRKVMTEAATFHDIQGNIFAMVIWAIILIGFATLTFSFQEKDGA